MENVLCFAHKSNVLKFKKGAIKIDSRIHKDMKQFKTKWAKNKKQNNKHIAFRTISKH